MTITLDTFIIADTHFGHENIHKHEPIRKQYLGNNPDQRMVELWNESVGKKETVFHLGDFAWKSDSIEIFADQLNGIKYLLRGNHDKAPQRYLDCGFSEVIDFSNKNEAGYKIAEVSGLKVMFSHYPIVSDGYDHIHWKTLSKVFEQEGCNINIHGHIHSMKLDDSRCINASVEAIVYRPIRLAALLERFS